MKVFIVLCLICCSLLCRLHFAGGEVQSSVDSNETSTSLKHHSKKEMKVVGVNSSDVKATQLERIKTRANKPTKQKRGNSSDVFIFNNKNYEYPERFEDMPHDKIDSFLKMKEIKDIHPNKIELFSYISQNLPVAEAFKGDFEGVVNPIDNEEMQSTIQFHLEANFTKDRYPRDGKFFIHFSDSGETNWKEKHEGGLFHFKTEPNEKRSLIIRGGKDIVIYQLYLSDSLNKIIGNIYVKFKSKHEMWAHVEMDRLL